MDEAALKKSELLFDTLLDFETYGVVFSGEMIFCLGTSSASWSEGVDAAFQENCQHLIGIIVRDDWIFSSIGRELSEYFHQRESFLKVIESIQLLLVL